MKNNTISTKIKSIGILFVILMSSILATTIYLNDKNKKDALIINIAGKQRMLTQNISKNIFYLYHNNQDSYSELDTSTIEFIYNLNSLKDGNTLTGIAKAPTDEIAKQLAKVEILWNNFYLNINNFKDLNQKNQENFKVELKNIVNSIYKSNTILLNEVDNLVSMYTIYSEEKSNYLRYVQYLFALIIVFLIINSFFKLKSMEDNAKKFFEESKKMVEQDHNEHLTPIKIEAEKEIVEATDTINCFIEKINAAVAYSANAMEQSKNASIKLEEISDEFDKIINDLTNTSDISKQLNKSEDIMIQSQEDLINTTKRLQELKNELDKILNACHPKNESK
uniref:type IV pili methyl-accepting chemotaxis transducer N-terminal domain-containing protein n=1 Tax=Aliarcobacter sp. TaxID=2321116 RepID=UPI0040489D46